MSSSLPFTKLLCLSSAENYTSLIRDSESAATGWSCHLPQVCWKLNTGVEWALDMCKNLVELRLSESGFRPKSCCKVLVVVTPIDSRQAWGGMWWLISSLILISSVSCYNYPACSAGAVFIVGHPFLWVKACSSHAGHQNCPGSPIFALVAFCTGYSSWCIWINSDP